MSLFRPRTTYKVSAVCPATCCFRPNLADCLQAFIPTALERAQTNHSESDCGHLPRTGHEPVRFVFARDPPTACALLELAEAPTRLPPHRLPWTYCCVLELVPAKLSRCLPWSGLRFPGNVLTGDSKPFNASWPNMPSAQLDLHLRLFLHGCRHLGKPAWELVNGPNL